MWGSDAISSVLQRAPKFDCQAVVVRGDNPLDQLAFAGLDTGGVEREVADLVHHRSDEVFDKVLGEEDARGVCAEDLPQQLIKLRLFAFPEHLCIMIPSTGHAIKPPGLSSSITQPAHQQKPPPVPPVPPSLSLSRARSFLAALFPTLVFFSVSQQHPRV